VADVISVCVVASGRAPAAFVFSVMPDVIPLLVTICVPLGSLDMNLAIACTG
jgi:hypothetical protein